MVASVMISWWMFTKGSWVASVLFNWWMFTKCLMVASVMLYWWIHVNKKTSSAAVTGCLPQGGAAGAYNSAQLTLELTSRNSVSCKSQSTKTRMNPAAERVHRLTQMCPAGECWWCGGWWKRWWAGGHHAIGDGCDWGGYSRGQASHFRGTPLNSVVSDEVKQDIWANKFVDLALLLQPHQDGSHHYDMVFGG